MLIEARQIDDFKTARKDLMPPLPLVYRLVPILFYLSLIFLALVGSLAMWHARVASVRYQEIMKQVTEVDNEIKTVKTDRGGLEKNYREATQLYSWVESSMPLQPLVVAIINSMEPGSTIVDLSLERDAENPAQLRLGLTVNTESETQLLRTLDVINGKGYLEFSPTQAKVRGNIEYRAVLVRSKNAPAGKTPQDRQETVIKP